MTLLVAGLICTASYAQAPSPTVAYWATHALVKVRPSDPVPDQPSHAVTLYAARNEFEPFQVALQASSGDVGGMDVEVSDLVGPDGAMLAARNITIYFEKYVHLQKASSIEGEAGEWPDPLIPRVDRYAGERRNAFPFTLAGGRNQPLWGEVYVPSDTPPGEYAGTLKIFAGGMPDIVIPIQLRVWNFKLPSTSSLPNTFGFNGVTALKQHRGRYTNEEDLYRITYLYTKAALLHRISTHGGSMVPPPFSVGWNGLRVDWTDYDREVGPFLDGTALAAADPLPGAKATSTDLRTNGGLDNQRDKFLYWKEWAGHFKEKGWFSRLFYYVLDEPQARDYPKIVALGRLSHQADPKLRNLVTTPFAQPLAGVVDLWTPLINCFQSKPGFPDFCKTVVPRAAYQGETRKGLWWYQSCGSHGCSGPGGEYFRGWPSYVIDVPATANRIMEWLTWKYRIQGELYYNLDEAFSRPEDPWKNIYMHGGNGDGTLVYPGRPDQIGGATDIPIESIRLKLIREGLEDYEYLNLLSQMGAGDFAAQWVDKIVKKPYLWESDPEALYAARKELGEKLNQMSAAEATKAAVVPSQRDDSR